MQRCGNESADGYRCILAEGRHSHHTDIEGHLWDNPEVLAELARAPKKGAGAAQKGREWLAGAAGAIPPASKAAPVVRASDPATAHEAAARYEPSRDSAKGRVLAYLREHSGQWVDAVELTLPEVGGFAGTRRMRELRDAGWSIETRPKPGETNTWQHRLLAE